MSLHKSLRINKYEEKRNVRKRYERLRSLVLQKKWDIEHDGVFALPKEKIIRLKVKKEEKEKKEEIIPIADLVLPTKDKKSKKPSKDTSMKRK